MKISKIKARVIFIIINYLTKCISTINFWIFLLLFFFCILIANYIFDEKEIIVKSPVISSDRFARTISKIIILSAKLLF